MQKKSYKNLVDIEGKANIQKFAFLVDIFSSIALEQKLLYMVFTLKSAIVFKN